MTDRECKCDKYMSIWSDVIRHEAGCINSNSFYEPIPKGDPDGLDADEANFDEDLE